VHPGQRQVPRQLESSPNRRLGLPEVEANPESSDLGRRSEQVRRPRLVLFLEEAGDATTEQAIEKRLGLLRRGVRQQLVDETLDVRPFLHGDQ
jgi:hypothetical protein